MKCRLIVSTCVFSAIIAMQGCSKGVEEGAPVAATLPPEATAQPDPAAPATATPAHLGDPNTISLLGLAMPKAESWTPSQLQNNMQAARYVVPGEGEAGDANLVFYFFGPGQGGDVQSNISRWSSQVTNTEGGPATPIVEQFEVAGMSITFVELTGTYQDTNKPAPEADQLFLAPIIEAPVGRVFIKLVGPRATVEANREAFMAMLNGLHAHSVAGS